MKECKYCGTQYQASLEACPNCGAAAVLTPEEKVTPEKQYADVKRKVERGRQNKLAIVMVALVLVVAIVVGAAALLLDDGSKEVMASTGLDKTQLKSVYAAGTTYMEQGDYANAAREFDKITGYKDAQALSGEAIAKYREAILSQAQSYSDEGRYTEAMMLIDTATATVGVDAAFDAKTNSIKEAYAQALIAQADEKAASGDYAGALELLQTAGGLVTQSADLTKKVTEVNSAYKARFFAEVDGLISQKNFTQALATLQTIQDVFGNDPDVNQKITATHKAKVLDKLVGYESAQDYAGAIGYINAELANTGNDSVVVTKLNTYKTIYKKIILDEAAAVLESKGYENAIALLKDGAKILSSDPELVAKIKEYENYEPISLFSFDYLSCGSGINRWDSPKDNFGNEYNAGIYTYFNAFGNSDYISYNLDGKYTELSGRAILDYDSRSKQSEHYFVFYGDDKQIYKTAKITANTQPDDFKFSIVDVRVLTIRVTYSNMWGDGAKIGLVDTFVYKK